MIFIERPKIEDALDEPAPARKHLATRANEAASLKPKSSVKKKKKEDTSEKSEINPIASRWNSFTQGKGADNLHGPRICDAVKSFCRHKCVYCESPSAATIDHFWPKSEHPQKMFNWDNLLASCRDCNSEKRDDFKVDEKQCAVMIDPTRDEPLRHFRWDVRTGKCLYQETDIRAVETACNIDMDRFQGERWQKLANVKFLLALCSERPAPVDLHERLRNELDASRPYLCIIRSYFLYPPHADDHALVQGAIRFVPEILNWVRPWLLPPAGVAWPPQ